MIPDKENENRHRTFDVLIMGKDSVIYLPGAFSFPKFQ